MAIIHQATLTPSKLEVLTAYLSTIPALADHAGDDLGTVGAYRFDDPAGNVGIETHLLGTASGTILHIPVVYRNDPLDDADGWFVGTMEHSVLGQRWVYEASIDPIYAQQLATTILLGGSEVEEMVETPDGPVAREPSVHVRGTGSPGDAISPILHAQPERRGDETHIRTEHLTLRVQNVLVGRPAENVVVGRPAEQGESALLGTWATQTEPVTLATAHSE